MRKDWRKDECKYLAKSNLPKKKVALWVNASTFNVKTSRGK